MQTECDRRSIDVAGVTNDRFGGVPHGGERFYPHARVCKAAGTPFQSCIKSHLSPHWLSFSPAIVTLTFTISAAPLCEPLCSYVHYCRVPGGLRRVRYF